MKSSDPEVRKLTQTLARAGQQPIEQVPLLEELVEVKVAPKAAAAAVPTQPAASAEVTFAAPTATPGGRTRYAARKKSSAGLFVAAGLGAVALLGGIVDAEGD